MAKLVTYAEQTAVGYGIRKTNRAGDTVITVPAGVEMLDEPTAIGIIQMGDKARGNLYQAVCSIVALNFGYVTAGLNIDPNTPKATSKAVSERIDMLLTSKGVEAKGRGSSAGQYRSIIARFIGSGQKLEPDKNGMLPSQKAVQAVQVSKTSEEIATGIATRILAALKTAEDEAVLEGVLNMLEANKVHVEMLGVPKTINGSSTRVANDEDAHDDSKAASVQ